VGKQALPLSTGTDRLVRAGKHIHCREQRGREQGHKEQLQDALQAGVDAQVATHKYGQRQLQAMVEADGGRDGPEGGHARQDGPAQYHQVGAEDAGECGGLIQQERQYDDVGPSQA